MIKLELKYLNLCLLELNDQQFPQALDEFDSIFSDLSTAYSINENLTKSKLNQIRIKSLLRVKEKNLEKINDQFQEKYEENEIITTREIAIFDKASEFILTAINSLEQGNIAKADIYEYQAGFFIFELKH